MKINKVLWVGDDGVKRVRFPHSKVSVAFAFYNLLMNYNRPIVYASGSDVLQWRLTCELACGYSKYGANYDRDEDDCSEMLEFSLEGGWRLLQQPVPSESDYSRQEFASVRAERFANKCFEEMEKRGTVILDKD